MHAAEIEEDGSLRNLDARALGIRSKLILFQCEKLTPGNAITIVFINLQESNQRPAQVNPAKEAMK